MEKFKEMEMLLEEEIVKRNMERIKKAEIIAEIKEAEIEGKFNEEIEAQVMKMHMAMEKLKEVDIEKLNEEYDTKQIEEEMGMKKKKTNRKRMETKKRRVARMEVDKAIMKKIQKMVESEYREMMIVEVTEKLKKAMNIMKKVKEAKNTERIKEAEIIKKIKNVIEAECLEGMVVEIMRKETEVLNIEKIKESEEINTSSTPAVSSASITKQPKIGCVRRAICTLFKTTLERCNFNIGGHQALIVSCDKEEYGDYACGNVLRIWPKLQEKGTKLQEPKDVGEVIIRNLPKPDMIEGTPSLHSFGIITFKISGKWMAKRIHKMLTDGIGTWAEEVSLKRIIVDFPSLDIAEGMHMDILRRRYISCSLTHMFQYLQVHVLNSAHEASHMDLARNVIKIEERDGEVMIYNKAEEELKLLAKTKSDRGLGNAFKDLGALWYGVEKLKAQRLLYVTPVAKKEYMEMCFTAAKCAEWISSAPLESPCAINIGYRSCTTNLEQLAYMLNEAKTLHKVVSFVLRGNVANYTARDVLECAIQYTILKTNRMAECTFDIDEMLDEEGNTFLYLLNTQARIRSITNKSLKDVRELKKASEWISEKDDILKKGEERELGLHILDFPEVLRQACFSALPHNLCKYLYNLSEIFNRYIVSTFARGRRSRIFLLLCEATTVVMEKCFHLLDITPQSFKNELGVTRLIYGAHLSVERPINVIEVEDVNALDVGRDPTIIQNTRFEPFSIEVCVNTDYESYYDPVKLFGYIDVVDTYGLRSDGWVSTQRADFSCVHLFKRPWTDPLDIINGGCTAIGDPSCSRSVPFSSSMGIAMNLVAINEEENDFVTLCNMDDKLDFSKFLASELDGYCGCFKVASKGGSVRINYILLKDAVDATFEVTFKSSLQNREVHGAIHAYYEGGFLEKCDAVTKSFYTAQLFQLNSPILKGGPIQLKKSFLAVPRNGSLKVMARLQDGKSWKKILDDSCIFPSQTNGSITKSIKGTNCSFEVKVNWSYSR